MKACPILMSAPMVLALLDGRKSQTRRVIKPQPTVDGGADDYCPQWWLEWKDGDGYTPEEMARLCPYGQPGDLLWVRETWRKELVVVNNKPLWRARYPEDGHLAREFDPCKYKPSIYMPRWASRLTLELTGVRVERLHDISEADAKAEGDPKQGLIASENTHRDWYQALWESINGPDSWTANPWVWVLSFKVHQVNVDELLKRGAA